LLIAQALVRRPKLLLLDEHSTASTAKPVVGAALISRICREEGVTVVMVAHDVNPILTYLTGGLRRQRGAVSGRPTEVITSTTLSRLYDTPIEVLTTSDGRLVVSPARGTAHHSDRHTGCPMTAAQSAPD